MNTIAEDAPPRNGASEDATSRLLAELVQQDRFRSTELAAYYFRSFFGDEPLAGRRVLDIGSGRGWLSLYALARGARHAVGLEPEFDGSHADVLRDCHALADALGVRDLEVAAEPIQTFDPAGRTFDLVLSSASINHLDEAACERLHRDEAARDAYRTVLRKIHGLMDPGGTLIITDASRYNVFPALGVKNPFSPQIEWHKHQSPRLWARLLGECGFERPRISWRTSHRLRPFGALGRNALVAYLFHSRFRLAMRRS